MKMVSVIGYIRMGKSFLLSGLTVPGAFAHNSGIRSFTRGVHVLKQGDVLYNDVEGVGSHNIAFDTQLLTVVLLTSDVILFNHSGPIIVDGKNIIHNLLLHL